MLPWIWICIGVGLLGLEVLIQTEFWLAFIGLAALLVGGTTWLGLGGPMWMQWLQLGVFSVILTVFFRKKIHEKLVSPATGIGPELVGEQVIITDRIDPGARGTVEHRGSRWQAHNVGDTALQASSRATVQRVSGIELDVRA